MLGLPSIGRDKARPPRDLPYACERHNPSSGQPHQKRGPPGRRERARDCHGAGVSGLARSSPRGTAMSILIQDLRYALRMLARAPGFSAVIILTLGLGIGANTAIFSLMDQVLLRRLPVNDPPRWCSSMVPARSAAGRSNDRTFSYPMYRDLRDGNTVFSGLVARFGTPATLTPSRSDASASTRSSCRATRSTCSGWRRSWGGR